MTQFPYIFVEYFFVYAKKRGGFFGLFMLYYRDLALTKIIQRLKRASIPVLVLLMLADTPLGLASSWSPALIVNTESFQQIDPGTGTTTVDIQFGASTKTLKLLTTNIFQFNKPLSVVGNLSGSTLTVDGVSSHSGAAMFKTTITARSTVSGANLTFMGASSSYILGSVGIGNSSPKAKLDVSGTLSGNTLTISKNGSFSGALTVLANLNIMGTLTGNMIHTEKWLTSSGLIMVSQKRAQGSGALVVRQLANSTGAYLSGSGVHVNHPLLALDSSTGSVSAPHILFGYKGTFDISLYRTTGAILRTNATSLTAKNNLSGATLNIGGSGMVPTAALCFKATGRIGYCSSTVGAGGLCTCN